MVLQFLFLAIDQSLGVTYALEFALPDFLEKCACLCVYMCVYMYKFIYMCTYSNSEVLRIENSDDMQRFIKCLCVGLFFLFLSSKISEHFGLPLK